LKKVFKNKNIFLLWIGQFISHIGDSIYLIALPWLTLDLTGSKMSTAFVATSTYLPALIFGLFAGTIADRFSRKSVMMFSDLFRAITVIMIPIFILNGNNSIFIISIIAFLISTFGTPFYPARDSLIPTLVDKNDLPQVNSIISISSQLSYLIGPIIAGSLVGIFGLPHLFTIDAITFLISFLFIYYIKVKAIIKINKKKNSYLDDIKSGISFLKSAKGIKVLIIMTSLNNLFIMGPAIIGIPVYVREVLKEEFSTLAILESAMALGMLFGAFIFIRFLKNKSIIKILFIGIIADGITYSFLFFTEFKWITVLILFIHGIGIPLIVISRINLIQKLIPDQYRGRIFAMVNMSVLGTTAISAMLTGFSLEFISSKTLFLIIGICAMGTMMIGYYSKDFRKLEIINLK